MSNNTQQEFRVGIVALVIAGITAALVTLNTGFSVGLGASPYQLKIRADRAPGVGPSTPVRKDGVLIGRVAGVEFLQAGGVLITADIEPAAPIYRTDECSISPSSLFGDAVVSFSYQGGDEYPDAIEPGSMIEAEALPNPVEALTTLQVDVGPTLKSVGEAAEGVTLLMERLNRGLGDDFDADRVNTLMEDLTVSLQQFQKTMGDISTAMNGVDRLIQDPSLESGLADVPTLIAEARGTISKANQTLESFGTVVTSAEKNLVNLEGFTKPLGDRGPELSRLLISAIENLDKTLADASSFVNKVNDSEGSLNRLLNDPALYDNVSTVVGNANIVMLRLDQTIKQLRPILYDIRVFTDKIAREPGSLIGRALNRGPGIK